MAAAAPRLICPSSTLTNGGLGVRFELPRADGGTLSAFVVRYQGRVHGYVNACRHMPVELDLQDGLLFDLTGRYLVCSMHGACYRPDDGLCVAGPCRGQRLQSLDVCERDGLVWLNVISA